MSDSSIVKPGQQKGFKIRVYIFFAIIIFILLALFLKIGYIQIIKNPVFKQQSETYRERIIRIPPIRGKIFSADEQVLASNNISYNLYISPKELAKDPEIRQSALLYLGKVLNYDYLDLEKLIKNNLKSGRDILLAENIPFITFIKIKENLENMAGIMVKEILIRDYPNKKTLSHVLGYIAPIDSNEFSILKKEGYQNTDLIGKNGIEKGYEKELRGIEGRKVYEIDARMKVQKEISEKEVKPQPGNELVLTIDLKLQKTVEDILANRIGSIVVLKPQTGEILAMASFPNYDPNIYILQSDENDEMKRQIALDTRGTPLINRAIQSVYPPGSVFKLVTGSAILQENIVSTEKEYFCAGLYRINNETFGCWVRPGQHGWQNLSEAIMNSCDVYFYNTGLIVGIDRISKYANLYGFGKALGLDISFESTGLIPSKQWKKSIGQIWYDGDTLNSVIGQGDVKVTVLQVANFMAAICNKGYAFRPHLVKQIRSSVDGTVMKEAIPEKIINLEFDENVFDYIHYSLRRVTSEGTAGRAFASNFASNKLKFAGKTGTAEVGMGQKKQTHSWFAGFGPVDTPLDQQIAVVVLCEYENGSFLRFAAPIASMVFSAYYNKEDYLTTAKRLWYPIKDSYAE
ncbi:MAG: penicillin-binding protein 2 [Spirochaetes bacterium GWD1_27_9]|nr:MAG: penicillin-binding protein 2 [Spirochaetes bacterium GWB1_27_13]OHD23114.1 MAG: penicillin-binding protein 2 [Spirochaetes bacterium GWC1_27_15]OHD39926.1 MAG: penicillin-binding protein 2 [Spirochaetes bacterium GWD1_27_9]